MLDDPENRSICYARNRSRGERGSGWGGEWVVVEVGQEELRSATSVSKKKIKKRKKKILQGLDGLRNENPNSCDYCT